MTPTSWSERLYAVCEQWAAETGLPMSLVVGPLLSSAGASGPEYVVTSAASLRSWIERVVRETGMSEAFLVFAMIRAMESFMVHRYDLLPERHAHALALRKQTQNPNPVFDLGNELEGARREIEVWRRLTLPILAGTHFAGSLADVPAPDPPPDDGQ